VLLISCFELGHQPLGVASPAAFLERAGFSPAALDLSVQHFDESAVRNARLVAISVPMLTALRMGVQAARRVRAVNPKAHLCFFGLYATLNAEHLLSDCCDSVLGGEVEAELTKLAQRLATGEEGQVTSAPVKERLDFPVPSRRLLPTLSRYAHLLAGDESRLAGSVEASRGCLHTCRHCPITPVYGGRFFVVPREVVLADVAQQVNAGARHITFGDPDFLNGPKHSLALVREMHARWPELTFDATIKVEHILKRRDLLPELRACGGLFIVSAFESTSDRVLQELEKGHTAADLTTAVHALREAGLDVRPTFVAFSPWETLDDRIELFDFVEREGLLSRVDPIQFTLRLLIPPGSPLIARLREQGQLGALDREAFTYRWTHPDPRMEALSGASARLVKDGVQRKLDDGELFDALWTQTLAVAGQTRGAARAKRDAVPGPRLSESWFCCAEPTDEQLAF
jgi:radical SAM superfamily enzyme YgiQ (UPF0313 family)